MTSMWARAYGNICVCMSMCVLFVLVLVVSRAVVDPVSCRSYTSDQQKTDESHLISVAAQRPGDSYFPGNTHTHTHTDMFPSMVRPYYFTAGDITDSVCPLWCLWVDFCKLLFAHIVNLVWSVMSLIMIAQHLSGFGGIFAKALRHPSRSL